jgi:hypothetical protein
MNDAAGEWEYDIAKLQKEKERPYTPPRAEPIDYLIEDLKIMWEPRPIEISDSYLVTTTVASTNDLPKKASNTGVNVAKVKVEVEGERSAEDKNEKVS